jgi:hypothetical protein
MSKDPFVESKESLIVVADSIENPFFGYGELQQGLSNNTLVVGKTTALKLHYSNTSVASGTRITVDISGPGNYQKLITWFREPDPNNHWDPWYNKFQQFYYFINWPYLVGRIKGTDIPKVGRYHFLARVFDTNNQQLESIEAEADFLPTKDLCVILSRIWGQPLTWQEIYEAHRAMLRFSTLLPVRDGLAYLDGGNRSAGLRYNCDFNPYPMDSTLGQFYDSYLKRPHNDPIHLGIAFRYSDINEGIGGNSGHWHGNIPFSVSVWTTPLAPVFCQESGHIMGLVPDNSPFSDGGGHSNQIYITSNYAALGYDIQYNRPFSLPVYDVMNGIVSSAGTPDDRYSFNYWDWEYLRQRLLTYNSTGPT